MENKKFTEWCFYATKKIRYGPDKEIVKKELMAHLEDAYEAHLLNGLSPTEAEWKVLSSMGSAEEIAPQLAAVRKPFWGYFECVTRYIACLMCVILFFVGALLLSNWGLDSPFEKKADKYHHFNLHNSNTHLECAIDFNPNVTGGFDGYAFTVDRLAAWQWVEHPDASGILCVKLDIQDRTLRTETRTFIQYLWVEDSLGNRYYDLYTLPEDAKRLSGYTTEKRMFSTSYDLFLTDFPIQDAVWIKICYGRDGRQMELYIDLAGGDTP